MIGSRTRGNTVQLSAHVFVHHQLPGSWCQNNIGIVQRGNNGSVLLVDTLPIETKNRQLRRILLALGATSIDVVNTHFHGDHTFGNSVFSEGDIFGTEATARLMRLSGDDLVKRLPNVDFGTVRIVLPNRIVSRRARLDADWGGIELLEFHDAHTASDLVVWVPAEGVLFTGDIAWNGVTPFTLMGSVTQSIAALEELLTLDATTIVPGHGQAGGPEVLHGTLDYLRAVMECAEHGIKTGATVWEAAEAFEQNGPSAGIDAERNFANIARAYADLERTQDFDIVHQLSLMELWTNRDVHDEAPSTSAGAQYPKERHQHS